MATKNRKAKATDAMYIDPLPQLDAAGVLDDFKAGGQQWSPKFMMCEKKWEIQLQAKTGRPLAITIDGPDSAFAISPINMFKIDEEFRKSTFPPPKPLKKKVCTQRQRSTSRTKIVRTACSGLARRNMATNTNSHSLMGARNFGWI